MAAQANSFRGWRRVLVPLMVAICLTLGLTGQIVASPECGSYTRECPRWVHSEADFLTRNLVHDSGLLVAWGYRQHSLAISIPRNDGSALFTSEISLPGIIESVAMSDSVIFISDDSNGVFIYDLHHPGCPDSVGFIGGPLHDIQVHGDLLIAGKSIFSVTDPLEPVFVDSLNIEGEIVIADFDGDDMVCVTKQRASAGEWSYVYLDRFDLSIPPYEHLGRVCLFTVSEAPGLHNGVADIAIFDGSAILSLSQVEAEDDGVSSRVRYAMESRSIEPGPGFGSVDWTKWSRNPFGMMEVVGNRLIAVLRNDGVQLYEVPDGSSPVSGYRPTLEPGARRCTLIGNDLWIGSWGRDLYCIGVPDAGMTASAWGLELSSVDPGAVSTAEFVSGSYLVSRLTYPCTDGDPWCLPGCCIFHIDDSGAATPRFISGLWGYPSYHSLVSILDIDGGWILGQQFDSRVLVDIESDGEYPVPSGPSGQFGMPLLLNGCLVLTHKSHLEVFSLSEGPQSISSVSYNPEGEWIRDSGEQDDVLYLAFPSKVVAISLEDPWNPVARDVVTGIQDLDYFWVQSGFMTIDRSVIYSDPHQSKRDVYDLADPFHPFLVEEPAHPWGHWGLHVRDGYGYILESGGLVVYELPDFRSSSRIGAIPGVKGRILGFANGYLMIVDGDEHVTSFRPFCGDPLEVANEVHFETGDVTNPFIIEIDARPNPFNPSTVLSFTLNLPGHADLAIYDLAGRHICTLASEALPAGRHVRTWCGVDDSGRTMPAGVYLAKLRAGETTESCRMVLLK